MRSMTGFGRGTAPLGEGRLVIEMKTVNHRFLEIRSRAPREFSAAESMVDKLARKHLNRGHCTVGISFEAAGSESSCLNTAMLESHLSALEKVAAKKGLPLSDMTSVLGQAPDLFSLPSFNDSEDLTAAVSDAFYEAIDKLMSMRRAEGEAMASDIGIKLADIRGTMNKVTTLAQGYAAGTLEKTRGRISELLDGSGIEIDMSRVEAEAAVLADRADINEELTRLASHCDQMASLLLETEPVGRRMEFLVQEMGREANTIGAKSASAEITHLVVDFKAELEKIRELAQNIE